MSYNLDDNIEIGINISNDFYNKTEIDNFLDLEPKL